MALGPGKYDSYARDIAKRLRAKAVLIGVIDGPAGSGVSLAVTPAAKEEMGSALPRMLRELADQIEGDAGSMGWPQ